MKYLSILLICGLPALPAGLTAVEAGGNGQDYSDWSIKPSSAYTTSFNFVLDSVTIIVTDSMFAKMTEDELKDFLILYITASNINYSTDSTLAIFFNRPVTISNEEYLEIMCRKFLPQWIMEEKQ